MVNKWLTTFINLHMSRLSADHLLPILPRIAGENSAAVDWVLVRDSARDYRRARREIAAISQRSPGGAN